MNVAILGAGTIVPDFLEAVSEIETLTPYRILGTERSRARMEELAGRYGIPKTGTDPEEALADEAADAVYVALPNHLHYEFAKRAILSGKHVIVEKPFAGTLAQARELAELAEEKNVTVFEAISNQYMPNYRKTRELLPELGAVKIIQLNFSQYSRRYDQFKAGTVLPVFDPKKSGGALMDLNVYNIHYVLGLFGKPEKIWYHANMERGIDTSGILVMSYPEFQCVCVGAKDCKAPVSVNLQGDRGFIHSDAPTNAYGSFVFGKNGGETQAFALNEGRPRLYYELKEFAEMVLAGDRERCGRYLRHTLDVQEILDEARRQAGMDI